MDKKKKQEQFNFKMMINTTTNTSTTTTTNFSVFSDQNHSTTTTAIFDDVVSVPSASDVAGFDRSFMGFADLLGIHDLGPNHYSLLDPLSLLSPNLSDPLLGPAQHRRAPDPSPTSSVIPGESSEVVNTPATPNSISISSSSSEAAVDGHHHHHPPPPATAEQQGGKEGVEDQNQDDEHDKFDKQLKPKTKKQKRLKEPRFAFMTKSEVDHLDDGYRWRKYGQKAVKNSPFPRSYYRCTTQACGVKKRVERSSSDPSIVVTTYEGQHTHPCPVMTRGGINLNLGMGTGMEMTISNPRPLDQCSTTPTQSVFGRGGAAPSSLLQHHPFQNHYFPLQNHHQQQPFTSLLLNPINPSYLSFTSGGGTTTATGNSVGTAASDLPQSNSMIHNLHQRHIRAPCSAASSLHQLKDDGLLQDMVPSQMRNEPTKEQ